MHRWLRVLICLLLVSCILVNLSPLRVEATAGTVATAVTLAVGLPVAVSVCLQSVGVRQGSSPSDFNQVVNDCVDALSSSWAVNGLTTMLALTTDGVTKTFANRNFLQDILDLLHVEGIVVSDIPSLSTSFSCTFNGRSYSFSSEYPFALACVTGEYLFSEGSYFSAYYLTLYSEGSNYISGRSLSKNEAGCYSFIVDSTISSSAYEQYISSCGANIVSLGKYDSADALRSAVQNYGFFGGDSITTPYDLTLESVGHDIETDYETYVETGIVGIDFGVQFEDDPNTDRNEEDDGNDLWLPVGIPGGSTSGSYTDQTQQDAQSGNTPQDVLDELLQNSGSGDGSGDGSGFDSGSVSSGSTWTPPSDHNQFALADLSKFFPFCIPFDLYDFFTFLNADPVAPVLSWEIKDLAGQTYSLDVDLSQWDSVALLFRRLQLFLFITGLAAASRKFIKW